MNTSRMVGFVLLRAIASQLFLLLLPAVVFAETDGFYTEPPVYASRPNPARESRFGNVGATGLQLHISTGVVLRVEGTTPGTPADGMFKKGEIIAGVNGTGLKGRNPYVVLGNALTAAEAKDGKLVFEVASEDGKTTRQVEVAIPVLGAYSPTWPLHCEKSQAIIRNAAAYYSKHIEGGGIEGALVCLFLLSTGDDQYLPVVKAYLDKNADGVKKSDHTWNNGYNGLAYCEYYLRTGDESALPVIQALCDNARDRQLFGIGWKHWGRGANPRYMDGQMNPASAQVVMSLLLAKECPVSVDEATLLGSLKFWYRFSGHGTVAYGDHRAEGGLGSNGKDGMGAVIMQLACNAKGDVGIYEKARTCYTASMQDSYACMTTGHADEGRGDAIWRGVVASYLQGSQPAEYHAAMDRLKWWYDLSRRPAGAFGVATLQSAGLDNEGSGAAVALGFTAPLRTLRITGAPRSKFAKDFSLPSSLWGRKSDLDFLSEQHCSKYSEYGADEPVHALFYKFGSAYVKPAADLTKTPLEEFLKSVYHRNYMIRAQAAKALKNAGHFGELEKLLQDKDPRIRRAALDGIIDYNYFFSLGKSPTPADKLTPGMIAAFRKMLADPDEALFVVDGALMALSLAPASEIADSLPLIQPWTTFDEWWLRDSAFVALVAAARDPACSEKILPILADMLPKEDRPSARSHMLSLLVKLSKEFKADSEPGELVSAAYKRAASETRIIPGLRAGEGGHYLAKAALAGIDYDPKNALAIARDLKPRLAELETRFLVEVTDKLRLALGRLPDVDRQTLTDLLYTDYRQEFIRRGEKDDLQLDSLSALTGLKNESGTWRDLGSPACSERVWKYLSFSPQGKATRPFTPPNGMETWFMPKFDDGTWLSGKAPVGKGKFRPDPIDESKIAHVNISPWGEGECLLMRTSFELDSLEYDYFRVSVLANQRFRIYLNGKVLCEQNVKDDKVYYQSIQIEPSQMKHLKQGKNVLAVFANALYEGKHFKGQQVGHFDMRLQGLRKADLLRTEE